jgi:hypothetical protein
VASIAVPAFNTMPPVVHDAHLIPTDIMRLLQPIWSAGQFAAREVAVYRLRDVVIAEHGLVLDRQGRIYRGSIAEHLPPDLERAASAAQAPDLPALPGTAVLCKKPGMANYGHWLLEMMPKYWMTRHHPALAAQKLTDAVIIVHDASGALRRAMSDSLNMLGNPMPIITFVPDMVLRVADLIVVDGLTEHGGYMAPLAVQACTALGETVPTGPPQLLFVSRTGADRRNFADSAAADRVARSLGWTVVHPEGRDFRSQVALFKGALGIVGILGAGMTNMVFARPGTRVVNLAPAAMPDNFFWFIAQLRGLRYEEYRCAQWTGQPDREAKDCDLLISPNELAVLLRRVRDDILG